MHDQYLQAFEHLGSAVRERWRRENFRDEAFSEISVEALSDFPDGDGIALDRLTCEVALARATPVNHPFGDVSARVFSCAEFFIEVLLWLDGTTSLHQHSFSGAFRVLEGESIHSRFSFDASAEISHDLHIGSTALLRAELLKRGDVREIRPGYGSLHTLFHLARPSITCVIRTHNEPRWNPQNEIYLPYVSLSGTVFRDERVEFCSKMVGAFRRLDPANAQATFHRLVEQLDVPRALALCFKHFDYVRIPAVAEFLMKRFSPFGEQFVTSIHVYERLRQLVNARAKYVTAQERFVLALIATVPDRTSVSELAGDYVGDESERCLSVVLSGLMRDGFIADGVDGESATEVLSLLLRYPDEEEFQRSLSSTFDESSVVDTREPLRRLQQRLKADAFIGHLFR